VDEPFYLRHEGIRASCFNDLRIVDFKNNDEVLLITFYYYILTESEASYSTIKPEFYRVVCSREALKLILLCAEIEILV
jgi:hypothetical protein